MNFFVGHPVYYEVLSYNLCIIVHKCHALDQILVLQRFKIMSIFLKI